MDLIERRGRGVTQRIFRFSAYLCALCGFFFAPSLSATVIVQKNGDVITGRILEEKEDKYVFQSPYGKLQISKVNVVKLILDEKTIELKSVEVEGKTVQARLVNQDKNTSVYLTEDGRTIRKEENPTAAPVIPEKKESPRNRFLIGVSGYYGYSTFQQVEDAGSGSGGQPPLNQAFHSGTFGGHLTGHYVWSSYLGFGLTGSFHRWSGTVTVAPAGQPISFDATSANTSIFAAPSAVFSFLGNLGATADAHDLRLELQAGVAFNAATMDLTFKSGATGTGTAEGRNVSPALQAQLYYTYSFSESFRVRVGAGYYRALYTQIYDPVLKTTSNVGQFKQDFEANLAKAGSQPQVIQITAGAEFGF